MSLYFPERPISSLQHPLRISIIASRYNHSFVDVMLEQTEQELLAIAPATKIEVTRVQGAFEIPALANIVATRHSPDAIIALGVILQGETAHARLIATSVTDALMRISLDHTLPVIHEVLLLEHEKQALDRCLSESVNRGVEAARAAFMAIEAIEKVTSKE
ncbi:MAG: 6,7-dimethyl-8-ribityllumazine synthase [Chthoniobacterales bacterium]|nr:6,7-dimethyl-8-ribityllumazine synthase [Chthoniobacterales bacterium]